MKYSPALATLAMALTLAGCGLTESATSAATVAKAQAEAAQQAKQQADQITRQFEQANDAERRRLEAQQQAVDDATK
ncbi:MAG: hypothetical protein QM639_09090 [Rhodocyclaceae bacterium]